MYIYHLPVAISAATAIGERPLGFWISLSLSLGARVCVCVRILFTLLKCVILPSACLLQITYPS